MRTASIALAFASIATPAAVGAQASPAPERASAPSAPSQAPDRVIVEWNAGVSSADRVAARADAETTLVRTLGAPSFQLLRVQPGQSVNDALAALRSDPAVRLATRDGYDTPNAIPNDPLFNQLWGLHNLGVAPGIEGFPTPVAGADADVPAAWDRTVGSPATVIADIDSGYRFDSPDLGPVAWTNPGEIPGNGLDDDHNGFADDVHGFDFVGASANSPSSDADPTDDNLISGGHGVHTAGTMGAAGNNGVGITGVAQNVRIMALRVCANFTPVDEARCPFASEVAAINYAGAMGARVANMSLGGPDATPMVRDAMAHNPQTLFVISAGNSAQNDDTTPAYPCVYDPRTSGVAGAIDNVVCVAATDQADHLASFSNWGAATVDVGAPGTETYSTYPAFESPIVQDFTTNDFATTWSATGAQGGFARTNESPLTSFGMSDSPGGAPVAGTTRASTTTNGVNVPAGSGSCTFGGKRFLSHGGGTFSYSVLSDNVAVFTSSPAGDTAGSAPAGFITVPITGLGGHAVKISFTYTAGGAPTAANGVWLDDLELECYAPLSVPPTYHYLEGTSMAAPHVTGAAGLLFSLKPSASVTDVRNALLAGVAPDPSLAGKTTTGGRLDVAHALSVLVPPDTAITSGPPGSTTSTSATFQFARSDSSLPATFECSLDGGAFAACASGASFAVPIGAHSFAVRAKDGFGDVDASPASAAWSVTAPVRCVVPRLAGKTLTQAKRALTRAHCKLGKVTKPRARKHHKLPPLVVKSTKPGAGAKRAANTKVALTLGPKPKHKPKPKKHKH